MNIKPKKTNHTLIYSCIFLLVVMCILIHFISCATLLETEDSAFDKAMRKGTMQAYKDYIKDYPDSRYTDEAKCYLIKKEWLKAEAENTIEAYEYIIEEYSDYPICDTEYIRMAELNILELKEELAFKNAHSENTVIAYDNFINEYPKSRYVEDAKHYIDQLVLEEYKETVKKNTIQAYEAFIQKYPHSNYAKEAKSNMVYLKIDHMEIAYSKELHKNGWSNEWLGMPFHFQHLPSDEIGSITMLDFLFLLSTTPNYAYSEKRVSKSRNTLTLVAHFDISDVVFIFRPTDTGWIIRQVQAEYEEISGREAESFFYQLFFGMAVELYETLS